MIKSWSLVGLRSIPPCSVTGWCIVSMLNFFFFLTRFYMSSNVVHKLVQHCRFRRVEIISCFLIMQYSFPGAAKAPQSLRWPLHCCKLVLFPVTSCCLMETVQSSPTSQCFTHTSSYTDFIEKIFLFRCNDASGFSLLLLSSCQLLDLELKQRCIVLPDTGEERSSSRVSRYKFYTSFLPHTNELFNNSDGHWDKLSANCGHRSGREEHSASGSAFLSSQVLLGWNQLRASVLTLQRDHLQVRMKTCFPSARVLQHTEPYWGWRAGFDIFSSYFKYYCP